MTAVTLGTNSDPMYHHTLGFTSSLHPPDTIGVIQHSVERSCCVSSCSSCHRKKEGQQENDDFERVFACSTSPPFLGGSSLQNRGLSRVASSDDKSIDLTNGEACVGRSLEFADATASCDLGAASDEWVAAFDSSVVSFDECGIHLELKAFSTSNTPAPRPLGEYGKGYDLSPMETDEFGVVLDDWPMRNVGASGACAQLGDPMMPPEARPPWENAAAADSRVVVCERVLPSCRPQTRRANSPFAAPSTAIPSEEAWRLQLRPRR